MPAKSKSQLRLIYAMRNKYKTKSKAPEKWKWVFDEEWTDNVKMNSLPDKKVESLSLTSMLKFLNK